MNLLRWWSSKLLLIQSLLLEEQDNKQMFEIYNQQGHSINYNSHVQNHLIGLLE